MSSDNIIPFPTETPRKRVPIDLNDLEEAMDDSDLDHFWYLDSETGEVIFLSRYYGDEESDELKETIENDEAGRYLDIPRADTGEDYRDMLDWAADLEEGELRADLLDALDRHRPFRNFRDVLDDYPPERQKWYDFKRSRVLHRAREWLEAEGIEPIPPASQETR